MSGGGSNKLGFSLIGGSKKRRSKGRKIKAKRTRSKKGGSVGSQIPALVLLGSLLALGSSKSKKTKKRGRKLRKRR